MFIVPFLSSLQLLPTVWSMCFLYGVVSKHSGESSTRYGSHIEMPTQGDLHSRISLVNYLITGLVFCVFVAFRSSRSLALRFWQQSHPACAREVRKEFGDAV